MFDWTTPPLPGQKLLDVGGASGGQHAAAVECSIVALDEDPEVFATPLPPLMSSRYHRVLAKAQDIPFAAASFDYVLCHHVLEHVDRPDRALCEMARVLKPDGGLSIAVPNGRGLCDAIYRYLFEGGGHVNRFSEDDVIALVQRTTGLRMVRWRKLYSSFAYLARLEPLLDAPPPDLQRRLLRLRFVPRAVLRLIHRALYHGTRYADRIFSGSLALYGWAFYFEQSGPAPVELPAMLNVCIHCGAGHPAASFRKTGLRTSVCPSCSQSTLYFRPFGAAV